MSPTDEALLDNPAYASLCGAHARFAQVRGRARRYPADVAPFLGMPSPPSPQDWRDAAGLVAPGTYAAVPYSGAELPDAWRRPENRFERSLPPTVDIYLPIHTPSGQRLLFEAYLPSHEVSSSARHLWEAFAPALFGGLLLLALVQLPLAWSLATRLRRGQQEREAVLQRAIDAADDERRRIAGELHDGVVQDLAGAAYSLAATAETVKTQPSASVADSLRATAGQMRQSIRALRTLLVDIYPANLRSVGLSAALSDLASSLIARGVEVRLDYPHEAEFGGSVEALLFRVAQEALRNVSRHANAQHVMVSVVTSENAVTLSVVDDGQGFSTDDLQMGVSGGHLGLSLLAGLADEQGGELDIKSELGRGTTVRVQVPRS